MKALSLTQPWATLVALGEKQLETRSWFTSYRGPLVIHAAKNFPKWAREVCAEKKEIYDALEKHGVAVEALPLGAGLCLVELVAIAPTNQLFKLEAVGCKPTVNQIPFGDFGPGRYAWALKLIKVFHEPIPAQGSLYVWNWPEGIE